jgi:predicted nucleic acid-binding Zn ribbon protein
MIYGDIYHLAAAEPPCDVVLIGQILVHLRDPLEALRQASLVARETLVITEGSFEADQPLAVFLGPGDFTPGGTIPCRSTAHGSTCSGSTSSAPRSMHIDAWTPACAVTWRCGRSWRTGADAGSPPGPMPDIPPPDVRTPPAAGLCAVCGHPLTGRRPQRVCSPRCRIARWRQTRAAETAAVLTRLHADNAALRQRVAELERLSTLPATLSEPGSGFIVPPLAERKIPIRPGTMGQGLARGVGAHRGSR